MNILAFETSCDETSVAVLADGVLRSVTVMSQVDLHRVYGGVVPEIASRNHLENIVPVMETALRQSRLALTDMDAIAVTAAPGLLGALLVGVGFARTLAYSLNKPCLPVHHIDAHIQSVYLEHTAVPYPYIAFVLSGGHTQIIFCRGAGNYEILGTTRDDSVGEAYDKVARLLDLGYPGGPVVDRLARQGNSRGIKFPKIFLEEDTLDFSLSGLKTAVYYFIKNNQTGWRKEDVCAAFQHAVAEVIVRRMNQACGKAGCNRFFLVGGVAANSYVREVMKQKALELGGEFYVPSLKFCTDNAAMVALAAWRNYKAGIITGSGLDLSPEAYQTVGEFFSA